MVKAYELVKTDLHCNMAGIGDRVVFHAPELDLQFIRWGGDFVQVDTSKDWEKTTKTNYTVEWDCEEHNSETYGGASSPITFKW